MSNPQLVPPSQRINTQSTFCLTLDPFHSGAMPVGAFLDKYVPATEEPLPDLSKKPFGNVPSDGVETSRYDPFVSTRLISETTVL